MATELGSVLFMGSNNVYPNPDIPRRNVTGVMRSERSALVFSPQPSDRWGVFRSARANDHGFAMPWAAIKGWEVINIDSHILLSGYFWTVAIRYTDSDYENTAVVFFRPAELFGKSAAEKLLRKILRERAQYIQGARGSTTIYSDSE